MEQEQVVVKGDQPGERGYVNAVKRGGVMCRSAASRPCTGRVIAVCTAIGILAFDFTTNSIC